MKRVISLLFLTFVLGLTQTAMAQQQRREIQLRPGQQKTIPVANLRIKFISVTEDSRCPTNVKCVWAGNAKVKVQVSVIRGETRIVEFNTNQGSQGDTFGPYSVRLVSLTPYPKSNKKIKAKDYRATISVARLTR